MSNLSLSFQSIDLNFPESIETKSPKEKVTLLILRDLIRLGWSAKFDEQKIQITPPGFYDKDIIKQSMSIKRSEIIDQDEEWIKKNISFGRKNLADGDEVLRSKIQPKIEVCKTQKQHDLFRILRYYWSSPYSEYVGRRIKLIVRDAALPDMPVIGIAALGSPIIHIPERDDYIGWNRATRTKKLNYMMDAYVVGALPPYNYLLGGKLMSYILVSNEVRQIFHEKYSHSRFDKLAGIFTTSLYGKSSQYNRLKMEDRQLYMPIGETKGFGTLHITSETFNAMNDYLKSQGIIVSNHFGGGPIWSIRVIKNAGRLLGFNAENLLMHSFRRSIYYVPLAKNTLEFLNGSDLSLEYYDQSLENLTSYWRKRWHQKRKTNIDILCKVKEFKKEFFQIEE